MIESIIEIKDLTKTYIDNVAVDHLSLEIKRGEIFGLLGPNGAGKSTTILMLLGLSEPTAGSVRVCGIDSTREPLKVKERVGYLPDDVGFYEDLSGRENLIYTGLLNRLSHEEAAQRADELLIRVGLRDAVGRKVGAYSRGMRQRLGLADVLIKRPEIIILDEPTLGLDPEGVRDLLKLIAKLSKEEGLTVLLSSHHLHQVQQICDRVGLFVKGKLLAEGDIHSLSQSLFGKDSISILVKLSSEVPEIRDALGEMNGVERIEVEKDGWHLSCRRDLSSEIARVIIEQGGLLQQLTKKEHGLDEIYHRYFEGGDQS